MPVFYISMRTPVTVAMPEGEDAIGRFNGDPYPVFVTNTATQHEFQNRWCVDVHALVQAATRADAVRNCGQHISSVGINGCRVVPDDFGDDLAAFTLIALSAEQGKLGETPDAE